MRTKLTVACALAAFVAVGAGTAEATGLVNTNGIARGAVTFNRLSPGVQKMVSVNATNGVDGTNGLRGLSGDAGEPGVHGADGATGAPGVHGAEGAMGAPGVHGADGATGAIGATGDAGATGATGATGAAGAAGATGAAGPQGVAGTTYSLNPTQVWSALSPALPASLGGTSIVDATCPAGKQVLGGGYSLQDVTQALGAPGGAGAIAADGVVVTYSAPTGSS